MRVPYSKEPKDILIRIIHQDIEDGLLSPIKTTAQVFLSEKLDDYVFRLGYSSAYIMGIVTQLMSSTKVHVDFPGYTERLELVNLSDQISPIQAMSLLEDYIALITQKDEVPPEKSTVTQRIVIRPTRFSKLK